MNYHSFTEFLMTKTRAVATSSKAICAGGAEETMSAPANCGCKSNIAQTLANMGVKMMLAGNMRQGAVNVLYSCGIDVLRGYTGDVISVAINWLTGTLEESGIACELHEQGCHEA